MDQLLDSAFMFQLQNSVDNWCQNSPTLLSSEGSIENRGGFSQPNLAVNNIADVITVAISSPFTFQNSSSVDPIQKAINFKQQQYYYNVNSCDLSSSSSSRQSSENKDDLHYVTSNNVQNSTTPSLKVKKSKHVHEGSRKRIRWTKELHRQFVQCVNVLGGPENATPKAILLMMGTDGLTILHVKSHLQKYRTTKSIPDDGQGKSDKTHKPFRKINPKLSNQINQALKMHMDVQKKLQDQLKIQRRLELQIEEQGKQLKQMLRQQYA